MVYLQSWHLWRPFTLNLFIRTSACSVRYSFIHSTDYSAPGMMFGTGKSLVILGSTKSKWDGGQPQSSTLNSVHGYDNGN